MKAGLYFLGGSGEHSHILSRYSTKNSQIFISKGYIPFNEVRVMQKLSAVNIILEAKSEISPFLPGKFPHCVEAGKPILLLGPYYSEVKRLLGNDYPYWTETYDIDKIAGIFQLIFSKWKKDPASLTLNRTDLKAYLSEQYLADKMNKIWHEV